MSNHLAVSSRAIQIALATVLIASAFAAAQSGSPAAAHTKAAKGKVWTMPRTPDGRPDLHGYWTSESFTPLERPAKYQGREFLTDEEAEEAQRAGLQRGFDRTY